jgi:translation initiation factor 4E
MSSAAIASANNGEHLLNTGHTIWVMPRRQKHTSQMRKIKKEQLQQQQQHSSSAGEAEQATQTTTITESEQDKLKDAVDDYEKAIKKIATFHTVEGFWKVYSHILRPSSSPISTDYHCFREGIKPVWEDPANRRGGKLVIKLKKGFLASRYWECLLLAMIGEQFQEYHNEICGIVISIRHNEDVLSLWTRNYDNHEALSRIRETLKKCLKLPTFVPVDFKRHDTVAEANANAAAAASAATATGNVTGASATSSTSSDKNTRTAIGGNINTSGGGGGMWRTAPPTASSSVKPPTGDWRS